MWPWSVRTDQTDRGTSGRSGKDKCTRHSGGRGTRAQRRAGRPPGTPLCFRDAWTSGHPTDNTRQEGKSSHAHNVRSGLKIELCFQIGF